MPDNNIPSNILDSLSANILFQIRRYEKISVDDLLSNIKTSDRLSIEARLAELHELITVVDTKTESAFPSNNQLYELTEKGHEVVLGLLSSEKDPLAPAAPASTKKSSRWFKPYWLFLLISTIVFVGIIIPVLGHVPFEKAAIYLALTLLMIGFGYYVRVKPPSVKTNRIIYIVLFGIFLGSWFVIGSLIMLSRMGFHDIDAFVIFVWVSCYVIGGFIGDLIGRLRHYKGPQPYSF
jgi:hypothetical protein